MRARLVAGVGVIVVGIHAGAVLRVSNPGARAQTVPAAPELFTRVGLSSSEAATAVSGQPAVRLLSSGVDTEIAVAGAIRIRGDVERLVYWLRDIEQFRRSLGADVVGAIDRPPRTENFAAISAADLDLTELQRCRPGQCGIRMPATYVQRIAALPWDTSDAQAAATGMVRQLLSEYTASYQTGGDLALGALHDQKNPKAIGAAFQDMVRRAILLWQLAPAFAAYLEDYPAEPPPGIEDRFYWTREAALRKPVATLHHVVLQRLPDGSLRFADKQFYASRDIEAGLLVGQATPVEKGRTFDLVVSMRARVPKLGSMAARVLRSRLEREITDSFAMYLDWLQRSFALG